MNFETIAAHADQPTVLLFILNKVLLLWAVNTKHIISYVAVFLLRKEKLKRWILLYIAYMKMLYIDLKY